MQALPLAPDQSQSSYLASHRQSLGPYQEADSVNTDTSFAIFLQRLASLTFTVGTAKAVTALVLTDTIVKGTLVYICN